MGNQIEPWATQGIKILEQEIGLTATYGPHDTYGQRLSIGDGSRKWSFRIACLRQLRPATAAHRLAEFMGQLPKSTAPDSLLLLTERISDSVGKILREQGIGYVDMGGNAWISRKGLHVWVSGQPVAVETSRAQKTTTPVALQLAFLLLQDAKNCARPYRELAKVSGLALGSVGWILNALIRTGYVSRRGKTRYLRSPRDLATHWEQHWTEGLRPKLNAVVCQGPSDPGFKHLLKTCSSHPGLLLGGELAASRIIGNVEPATATIHVPPGSIQTNMDKLRLLKNPNGNIRLLETFGTTSLWANGLAGSSTSPSLADPLLIRAELLEGQDGRLHDLARELLIKHITPRWEA